MTIKMVPIVVVVRDDAAAKLEKRATEIAARQPGFFGPLLESHGWTPAQLVGGMLLAHMLDEDERRDECAS